MARIGFIGLGHMGLPMAINLIRAGHEVCGFDLSKPAKTAFEEDGGRTVDRLSELANADNEILISMLQKGDQVAAVCLGEEGLYAKARSLALHIDCSSIDVETTRRLHHEAKHLKIHMVDAPVSGGVAGAKTASLTFMVGGEDGSFSKAKPILEAMGKNIFHTGISGTGQAAKICNNMILGISMIAISEAFVLAKELDLSPQKLHEVVTHSSGQCWAMSKYVPVADVLPDVPANRDYQPGFTAAMMLKDLKLSQSAAEKNEVRTLLARKAMEIYEAFNEAGFGDLDFSGVIKGIK